MPEIIVFTPPNSDNIHSLLRKNLGEVSGWLRNKGYNFDQKSLYVEITRQNKLRWSGDSIDLSKLKKKENVENFLAQGNNEISQINSKIAKILSIESYEVVLIPVYGGRLSSCKKPLASILPFLYEYADDKTVVIIAENGIEEDILGFPFIDYLIEGDFEAPLSSILEHELDKDSLNSDVGIYYNTDGEIHKADDYAHQWEKKSKPYYDKELLEKHSSISAFRKKILRYQIFRQNSEGTYETKNAEKVASELSLMCEETGASHVRFRDSDIFQDLDYIQSLAESLTKSENDIFWTCKSSPVLEDQSFFNTLAESGCTALHFDIGTMSESVIERNEDGKSRNQVKHSIRKAYRAGIKPFGYLRVGYPEETWDEYFETINFIRKNTYLMGAAVRIVKEPSEVQEGEQRNGQGVENNIVESEKNNFLQNAYKENLNPVENKYTEIKGKSAREKELKRAYMQRTADFHLFVRNYGRIYPYSLVKKALWNISTTDYPDGTYPFV